MRLPPAYETFLRRLNADEIEISQTNEEGNVSVRLNPHQALQVRQWIEALVRSDEFGAGSFDDPDDVCCTEESR